MPAFQYKALTADGRMTEGRLDVAGRAEALRHLEGLGLQPVRLDESGVKLKEAAGSKENSGGGLSLSFGSQRVSQKALENFMRQLSSLLAAGVPLARALQLLSRESAGAAASQWKQIHDMVIDGTPLADAMARLPETFPRVYIAMVRAGETGGFLDVVLNQIAEFQAREKELMGKVKTAMIYPCVLLLMAIGVLIFLLTFFIPRFQTIFTGLGAELPLLTRIIVGASDIVRNYGLIVVVMIALAAYGLRQWLQTDDGRRARDRFILRLPVIGGLNARFAMTRFCRMLGTLINSGVGLITGLRVARESIGNQTLVDAVGSSIERVQKGDALAASLADCPQLFPTSVIEMIAIAEESGRLDAELMRLADVTERELDIQLRTAVALTEPVMLFVLAGFIGTIIVGIVLLIFSIQDYIK